MYRIAFCDDDKTVLSELNFLLEKYRRKSKIQIECSVYNSPFDLTCELDRRKERPFDILFWTCSCRDKTEFPLQRKSANATRK